MCVTHVITGFPKKITNPSPSIPSIHSNGWWFPSPPKKKEKSPKSSHVWPQWLGTVHSSTIFFEWRTAASGCAGCAGCARCGRRSRAAWLGKLPQNWGSPAWGSRPKSALDAWSIVNHQSSTQNQLRIKNRPMTWTARTLINIYVNKSASIHQLVEHLEKATVTSGTSSNDGARGCCRCHLMDHPPFCQSMARTITANNYGHGHIGLIYALYTVSYLKKC